MPPGPPGAGPVVNEVTITIALTGFELNTVEDQQALVATLQGDFTAVGNNPGMEVDVKVLQTLSVSFDVEGATLNELDAFEPALRGALDLPASAGVALTLARRRSRQRQLSGNTIDAAVTLDITTPAAFEDARAAEAVLSSTASSAEGSDSLLSSLSDELPAGITVTGASPPLVEVSAVVTVTVIAASTDALDAATNSVLDLTPSERVIADSIAESTGQVVVVEVHATVLSMTPSPLPLPLSPPSSPPRRPPSSAELGQMAEGGDAVSGGAIAGIVGGGTVGCLLLACLAWRVVSKRQNHQKRVGQLGSTMTTQHV